MDRVMQLELSRVAAHLFTFGGHGDDRNVHTDVLGRGDRDFGFWICLKNLPEVEFTAFTTFPVECVELPDGFYKS